jgi:hypothetical protein
MSRPSGVGQGLVAYAIALAIIVIVILALILALGPQVPRVLSIVWRPV